MNVPPCPPSGEGVSDWIHLVGLKASTPAEAEAVAVAAVRGYGGRYSIQKIRREIRRAFEYKGDHPDFQWSGAKPEKSFSAQLKEIQPDRAEIALLIEEGPSLGDLYSLSPFRDLDAHYMIEVLFPGNPWLCCGWSKDRFLCRRRKWWHDKWGELQFIVPSPQAAQHGLNTDGQPSEHCLSNCLDRRFIVVEFDRGSKDAQAAILWGMRRYGLAMVVDSAGKSLHGWFYCQGAREERVQNFFRYACSLCADPVHWTRSQFTRVPNGCREGAEQVAYYFDPEAIK